MHTHIHTHTHTPTKFKQSSLWSVWCHSWQLAM